MGSLASLQIPCIDSRPNHDLCHYCMIFYLFKWRNGRFLSWDSRTLPRRFFIPLLFTLVMEILSTSLRIVANSEGFRFHWHCHKMKLTHLYFADDLLIFSRANKQSVAIILDTLQNFAILSDLRFNPAKSSIFVSNTCGNIES